jgi:hypothetical protein
MERYIADVASRVQLTRPLKVVAACGNGTAGAFAPEALRRMGVTDLIEMDTALDYSFPKYNPNPEDQVMLHAMADAVREHKADLCLGFDGDGDRCGVVDDEGEEIFADKIGLMLARDLSGVDLHRRRQVHRPFHHRSGAQGERRQHCLLEDGPQLYQAQDRRTGRPGRVREVRPLLLQRADRPRL